MFCAGAAIDWTVVRVVAIDRIEGAGDENVLSLPPSVLVVAVAPVPTPEGAASERAVSACVASVGARDLFPPVWLSCEMEMEFLLCDCDSELCRDLCEVVAGVVKERWPFVWWLSLGGSLPRPDSGYGLFLAMLAFFDFMLMGRVV